MKRAKTIKKAQAILHKILPPDAACDAKTYRRYIEGMLSGEKISIPEIGTLLAYYECHAEELTGRIVHDKMENERT